MRQDNGYPEDQLAWRKQGALLAANGRFEEAIEIYADALSRDDTHAWIWARYADILGKLRRDEEALAAYRRATSLDPRWAKAWAKWLRSVVPQPGFADVWFTIGGAYRSRHDDRKALSAYQRALALDPRLLQAWVARAEVLRDHSHYEGALASCDQALELDRNLVRAWRGRGSLLLGVNRVEGVLQAFERATVIDPRDADAWHGKGGAYSASTGKRKHYRPMSAPLPSIQTMRRLGLACLEYWMYSAEGGRLQMPLGAGWTCLRLAPGAHKCAVEQAPDLDMMSSIESSRSSRNRSRSSVAIVG